MAIQSKPINSFNDLQFVAISPNEIIQWYEQETDRGWYYYPLEEAGQDSGPENSIKTLLDNCDQGRDELYTLADAPSRNCCQSTIFSVGEYAIQAFNFEKIVNNEEREARCGMNAARFAILLATGLEMARKCPTPERLGGHPNIRGNPLYACYYPKDTNTGPVWIRKREVVTEETAIDRSRNNVPSIDERNYYANFALEIIEADALIGATIIDPKGWLVADSDGAVIPFKTSVKLGMVSQMQWRDAFNHPYGETRPGLARATQYDPF